MRLKIRVPVLLVLVMALVVSACATRLEEARGGRVDVAVPDDAVLCEYGAGGQDGLGLLRNPILPGSDTYIQSYKNRYVVSVPLSNRFYEVSELPSRDAGAPRYFEVLDKDGVPMLIQSKLHFVFNAEQACNWFDTHGGRNSAVEATYYADDGSGASVTLRRYDMGFNVRNRIVSPWLTVLNEQFGQVEYDVFVVLAREFSWSELVFNEDVEITFAGVVYSGPAQDVWDKAATAMFSDRLDEEYGDAESDRRFYCGPGHNQANPDDCRDIRVQTLDFSPKDGSLVDAVTSLATQREANRIAQERAREEQNQRAALQQIAIENADAEDDRLELERRLSDQRILAATIAAQEAAAIEAAELLAAAGEGGVDALTYEQQLRAAELSVAACNAAEVTGIECVYLISVLLRQGLPDGLGGTYVVPQGSFGN